jgi:hypothetical protein
MSDQPVRGEFRVHSHSSSGSSGSAAAVCCVLCAVAVLY